MFTPHYQYDGYISLCLSTIGLSSVWILHRYPNRMQVSAEVFDREIDNPSVVTQSNSSLDSS
jgi:hypothetical protein